MALAGAEKVKDGAFAVYDYLTGRKKKGPAEAEAPAPEELDIPPEPLEPMEPITSIQIDGGRGHTLLDETTRREIRLKELGDKLDHASPLELIREQNALRRQVYGVSAAGNPKWPPLSRPPPDATPAAHQSPLTIHRPSHFAPSVRAHSRRLVPPPCASGATRGSLCL